MREKGGSSKRVRNPTRGRAHGKRLVGCGAWGKKTVDDGKKRGTSAKSASVAPSIRAEPHGPGTTLEDPNVFISGGESRDR